MKKDAIISYLDRGRAKFHTISEQYGVAVNDIEKIDWDNLRSRWYRSDNMFERFLIWGEIKEKLKEFPGYTGRNVKQ